MPLLRLCPRRGNARAHRRRCAFGAALAAHGLDRTLFEAIARDLDSKGATIRKGTIIDATIIGSASKGDLEAAFVKHRTRPPAHGDFAHIAAGKDTGIIRAVETTLREFRSQNSLRPANEADVSIAPLIIPYAPGGVFGHNAYDAGSVKKAIKSKGGTSRLLRNGHRWLPPKKFVARNRKLAPLRARIAN